MREGWICPSCRRGVSPDEKHCDHGGLTAFPAPQMPTFIVPQIPHFVEPYPSTAPAPHWHPGTVWCGSDPRECLSGRASDMPFYNGGAA